MNAIRYALMCIGSLLLAGCSWLWLPAGEPLAPIIVQVSGYGAYEKGQDRTDPQQRLMVRRASQLDAYRALAERVYGTVINGSSGVNEFVLQNDSFRAYVDSYIRGAKVLAVTEHKDGVVETLMTLKLEPRFRRCVREVAVDQVPTSCDIPMPTNSDRQMDMQKQGNGTSLYFLE